jgi:uncharacterized membrane protein YhaH (DUF805 family)
MFQVFLGWALCLLLAFVFLMVGGMKLLSRPLMVREVDQIGARAVVPALYRHSRSYGLRRAHHSEVKCWAALLLAVVMVGAIIAHSTVLHSSPVLAAVLLALIAVSMWLRR